jgi:hypothetical protein
MDVAEAHGARGADAKTSMVGSLLIAINVYRLK